MTKHGKEYRTIVKKPSSVVHLGPEFKNFESFLALERKQFSDLKIAFDGLLHFSKLTTSVQAFGWKHRRSIRTYVARTLTNTHTYSINHLAQMLYMKDLYMNDWNLFSTGKIRKNSHLVDLVLDFREFRKLLDYTWIGQAGRRREPIAVEFILNNGKKGVIADMIGKENLKYG